MPEPEVRIRKYKLETYAAANVSNHPTTCTMPYGAKVLGVHEQNGTIYLWAEVIPIAPEVEYHWVILSEEDLIPMHVLSWNYLGTVHIPSLDEVWSVYMDPLYLRRP